MLVALHSEIVPGRIDGYVSTHQRIPDDLVAAFERLGIHDWTIWRSGHRLFHLVDCDDWDAALASLADEPADHAWQRTIGPFVEVFRDAEGGKAVAPLAEVWSLAAQRDS